MSRTSGGPGMLAPGQDRVAVGDPIEALARAWHREACALKRIASHQCKFWSFHLLSAGRVVDDLRSMGWDFDPEAPR